MGNFDDAQTGVKKLFSDTKSRETLNARGYFFSTANSINWGRLRRRSFTMSQLMRSGEGRNDLGRRLHQHLRADR